MRNDSRSLSSCRGALPKSHCTRVPQASHHLLHLHYEEVGFQHKEGRPEGKDYQDWCVEVGAGRMLWGHAYKLTDVMQFIFPVVPTSSYYS